MDKIFNLNFLVETFKVASLPSDVISVDISEIPLPRSMGKGMFVPIKNCDTLTKFTKALNENKVLLVREGKKIIAYISNKQIETLNFGSFEWSPMLLLDQQIKRKVVTKKRKSHILFCNPILVSDVIV